MALPVFFRWSYDVVTQVLQQIYQIAWVHEDGRLQLFDVGETPAEDGWHVMTDAEWDERFPPEPEEPPVDPEPQE